MENKKLTGMLMGKISKLEKRVLELEKKVEEVREKLVVS